ncbi:MAG: MoaD/ThiS family protein [Candidatus Bathyarchaeia archaeon]
MIMRVLFKFYGNLMNYFGEKASIEVEEGVTVQEALMKLKLVDGTPAYASIFVNTHLQMFIVFVSGKHADLNTRLKGENVEVTVLPPIMGG